MKKLICYMALTLGGSILTQAAETPAPLYRDPITDGAADPCLVYNRGTGEWWMLYTQRRANAETADVAYCYGNSIGIASSDDGGATWVYRGTLDLDFEPGHNTFWAPDVVWHDGKYHLFVTYIRGVRNHWGGGSKMMHYTSENLWDWHHEGACVLPKKDVIDATLLRKPDGEWRMWYKWDSKSYYADSPDLVTWTGPDVPSLYERPHEGAKAFKFKDRYWVMVDEWEGMGIYSSTDLENWTRQEQRILDGPSTRQDDCPTGSHGDVVVAGDRAWVFYFTHPGRETHSHSPLDSNGNQSYRNRRSSIQVAELTVLPDGTMTTLDRNRPVDINLTPPEQD